MAGRASQCDQPIIRREIELDVAIGTLESRMNSTIDNKVVTLERLLAVVHDARSRGKTIVQCHGCFDLVHPGHIRYLEFARRQGDVLIVSITGDTEISKGDQRPYIPQELRAETLAALMFVDYVYIDPTPTAREVLRVIRPDVYVKGREYEHSTDPGFLVEKQAVESYGGRIIYSSGDIVFSSTKLLERMPAQPELQAQRLSLLCRRHGIDAQRIEDHVRSFGHLRVVVVGDTVIDRYVFCDAIGVASESPMMSLAQVDETSYVGGAAMVARHIAALGAKVCLMTAGTQNDDGRQVADTLDSEGVDLTIVQDRPALVTKTRFLAEETKLFKVDRAQRLPLDSEDERHAAKILCGMGRSADAVVFCDFGYGLVTSGLLGRTLPSLRQNVKIITADVSGGRANLLNFDRVDLLCPTEREVRSVLNDYDIGLSAAAWQLLSRTQARHLLVTLEKRGMLVFQRRNQDPTSTEWAGRLRSEHLPSLAEHAVDGLGCGDALLAAATLSLAAGASLMQAAYLGNATAAIEIGLLGNIPVTSDRLREWLRSRYELSAVASTSTPAVAAAP